MYYYRHPDCRGVAFYLDRRPVTGEAVQVKEVSKLDGTQPVADELIICGTCSKPLSWLTTDNIFEVGNG